MVTWREETDLLRCSSSFHTGPRYDSIIFHDHGDVFNIANLVFAFICRLENGEQYPLLLVQQMEPVERLPMHKELGLYPFKAAHRSKCRVVPLQSLVRGAVLYGDTGHRRAGHYFAVDVIDSDMFLRLKSWFG